MNPKILETMPSLSTVPDARVIMAYRVMITPAWCPSDKKKVSLGFRIWIFRVQVPARVHFHGNVTERTQDRYSSLSDDWCSDCSIVQI